MNRRNFIKTAAVALLVAGFPTPVWPAEARTEVAGKILRGDAAGRIFESADGGRTWQLNVNFGPDCSILRLVPRKNSIIAVVGFQNYQFYLRSTDGKVWYLTNTELT